MMRRLSPSNLYGQVFKFLPLTGIWKDTLGDMERRGCWIIYGNEKQGKSSFALHLAHYLTSIEKVLYISGEEGTRFTFIWKMRKMGISVVNKKFHVWPYIPMEKIIDELEKNRKAEKIVFVDSITVYKEELKGNVIFDMMEKFPDTLFIFIAHEENGVPQYQPGDMAYKYADAIFHVRGLAVDIISRTNGPGGTFVIDPDKAAILHGDKINHQNREE